MRYYICWLVVVVLSINTVTQAQIVYESSHYASVGDSFIISNVDGGLGSYDFEVADADTAWDYSQLQPSSQEVIFFSNPDNTGFQAPYLLSCNLQCFDPCVSDCVNGGLSQPICQGICAGTCGADCFNEWNSRFDLAEQTNDSSSLSIVTLTDIYNFYQKESNALNQVGLGAQVQGFPVIMGYGEVDRVYKFPLNYTDTDVSVSDYGISLDSIPGTGIVTGITYKHAQTRSTTVEGWGALTTPFAHFDTVLKVKAVIHNRDTVIFQGDTLYLQNILPETILPDSVVEYTWLSKDYGYPVFSMRASLINGNLTGREVAFIDTVRCFSPNALFGYLPIPATIQLGEDSVEVNFFSQAVNTNSITWNFDDPMSDSSNTANGNNPSHWFTADGTYNVQMIACNKGCSMLQCDTFSLPVIVIDNNPDAIIERPDYEQLAIYPNPFINEISLTLPITDKTANIVVYDIRGRLWMRKERLQVQGKITLDVGELPPNLYLVKVVTESGIYFTKALKVQ